MAKIHYDVLVERQKHIYLDAYGYRITVVLTNSIEGSLGKREKTYPRTDWPKSFDNTLALHVYQSNNNFAHIILPFNPNVGTVVHEVYHALHRLMYWIGAEEENEIMAYHLGYVCHAVARFCNQVGVPDLSNEVEIPDSVIEQFKKKEEQAKPKPKPKPKPKARPKTKPKPRKRLPKT